MREAMPHALLLVPGYGAQASAAEPRRFRGGPKGPEGGVNFAR